MPDLSCTWTESPLDKGLSNANRVSWVEGSHANPALTWDSSSTLHDRLTLSQNDDSVPRAGKHKLPLFFDPQTRAPLRVVHTAIKTHQWQSTEFHTLDPKTHANNFHCANKATNMKSRPERCIITSLPGVKGDAIMELIKMRMINGCVQRSVLFSSRSARVYASSRPGTQGRRITFNSHLASATRRFGFLFGRCRAKAAERDADKKREGGTHGRGQPACDCCGSRIWALIKRSRGKKKKEMRFVGFLPRQYDENVRELSPCNMLFVSQCVRASGGLSQWTCTVGTHGVL